MKIKHVDGIRWWCASHNCFTHVKRAATEYKNGTDLPMIIKDTFGAQLELGEGYYCNDNDEAIASLEQKK